MPSTSGTPVTSALKSDNSVIARTMRVRDIQMILPTAEECMAQYGLHCAGCGVGGEESLEEGCRMHGMSEADIDDLVTDLNILLAEKPARPKTLTLTDAAAQGLKTIMDTEEKQGWILMVGLDESGGFSMEFREKPDSADHLFKNEAVPEVQLSASDLTLAGIGGATIDVRDGRFKLDLPEDQIKKSCCQGKDACDCGGGECGCKK